MKSNTRFSTAAAILAILGFASPAPAATVTFKDGSTVLSSDGLIDITNYQGTEDASLVQESANNNYGGRNEILLGPLGGGKQRAGVIRFDVTSMAGIYQTIDSVKLRFTVVRLRDRLIIQQTNLTRSFKENRTHCFH
jgi:hypothetical protein